MREAANRDSPVGYRSRAEFVERAPEKHRGPRGTGMARGHAMHAVGWRAETLSTHMERQGSVSEPF